MRFFRRKTSYFLAPLSLFLGSFLPHGKIAMGAGPTATSARPAAAHTASAPASPAPPKTVAPAEPPATRWTAATPDPMASQAATRALFARGPAAEREAVASMAILMKLEDRASYGHVRHLLEALVAAPQVLSEEVRGEAAMLVREIAPDQGTEAGIRADRAAGILTDLSILGPFRDTGGGLDAHDGPEGPGGSFTDAKKAYSWGTYEVTWRKVPAAYATASGVPLDVFIHPRKESCTWVTSPLHMDKADAITVRVAATGQVRLMFDGAMVGRSDDVHTEAIFDRLAARVQASAGDHLVAAKVCTGALEDDGRVRLRVTHEARGDKDTSTPLTRTLAVKSSDAGAMLDAAVARTLGGADDARSPRAPGMLDAITRTPKLDADRLALAGWIAPSGSNRSGWLYSARTRAAETHDEATLGFTERRLIAEHLRTKMADWAMASLRGAKLIEAADPEAVLLRAETYDALNSDTLRLTALIELRNAADRNPDKVPTALLWKLLTLSSTPDAARAARVSAMLSRRGYLDGRYLRAESLRGAREGIAAAQAIVDRGMDDADDGIAAARAVSRLGDHAAARGLFARLVGFAPNRADAWAGLADEMTSGGSGDKATTALQRARELAPGDAHYRAELALRREGAQAEASRDERYLVPSQTILARRQGAPKPGTAPDVADRQLYWLRAVVSHADQRVSQLIQYGREVVIAPRTEDDLYEEIPAEGDLT